MNIQRQMKIVILISEPVYISKRQQRVMTTFINNNCFSEFVLKNKIDYLYMYHVSSSHQKSSSQILIPIYLHMAILTFLCHTLRHFSCYR